MNNIISCIGCLKRCVHVSAMLHALKAIKLSSLQDQSPCVDNDDETIICKWKVPKNNKESELKVSKTTFVKCECGKQRKYRVQNMVSSDPRLELLH